jgi:excisionase family DNA binding protein
MTGKDDTVTADDRQNAGQSDLLTIPQAAARLGKSERTIRRMIQSGKLGAIEISGRLCVQLAGIDTDLDMSGGGVKVAANAGQYDRHMSDHLTEPLRDTIRRQDSEITFLRAELTAARETVQTMTRMLTARTATAAADDVQAKPTRRAGGLMNWLVVGLLAVIVAAVWYWALYIATPALTIPTRVQIRAIAAQAKERMLAGTPVPMLAQGRTQENTAHTTANIRSHPSES